MSHRRTLILITALVAAVALALVGYVGLGGSDESRVSGRVAYVVDGNLFIKELPDGEPQQITEESNAKRPEWSPSGEWLSYSTEPPVRASGDTNVWVMNAATGETREAGFPADWAPQHDYLITRPSTDYLDYSVVTTEGTELYVLEQPRDRLAPRVSGVTWSADGERVAYVIITGRRPDDGTEIHVMDINSGRNEVLYTHESDHPYLYGWSSDGQYLFFIDDTSKILSLDTGEMIDTGKELGINPHGAVQPDGTSILAVESTANGVWQGKRVVLLDPSTGEFTYLSTPDTVVRRARWSPDGAQISYIAAPDRSGTPTPATPQEVQALLHDWHVWIMDADGSNKRQLTSDARYREVNPEWTADGKHLLFVRIDLEFPYEDPSLWALNVSTGQMTQLVERMSYPPSELLPEGTGFRGTVDGLYDFYE